MVRTLYLDTDPFVAIPFILNATLLQAIASDLTHGTGNHSDLAQPFMVKLAKGEIEVMTVSPVLIVLRMVKDVTPSL